MSIAKYIKEIGRGREGAKNLSEADAYRLMRALLRGELSDLEIGAVVLAMRMKGESIEELAGFMQAAHEQVLTLRSPSLAGSDAAKPVNSPVVSIPSYNGARKLPNLVPLLAMLLAREGVSVLVHGVEADAGRTTTHEIFAALGLPIAHSAAALGAAWSLREPVFMPLVALSPPLARLLDVRRVVGVRNSGHTMVKMLNPLATSPLDHGVPPCLRVVNYTHPEYAESLGKFFESYEGNVLLMRGTEGEAVADARRSQAIDWYSNGERTTLVEAHAGVITTLPLLPRTIDAATTAAYTQSVLAGEHPVPLPIERQVEAILQCVSVLASRHELAQAVNG
jgi:anthranilate phosphoribosyltransferase